MGFLSTAWFVFFSSLCFLLFLLFILHLSLQNVSHIHTASIEGIRRLVGMKRDNDDDDGCNHDKRTYSIFFMKNL